MNTWHWIGLFNPLRPSDAYILLGHHWFKKWLVACLATSHCPYQRWINNNWARRNRFKWHFNWNTTILYRKIHFKLLLAKWAPYCVGLNFHYHKSEHSRNNYDMKLNMSCRVVLYIISYHIISYHISNHIIIIIIIIIIINIISCQVMSCHVMSYIKSHIITLVRHKKARFDSKMHGSTQKSPVRHKKAWSDTKMPSQYTPVDITII